MRTYFSFQTDLSEESIRHRIASLPQKNISTMTTDGQIFGKVSKNRFEIGYRPGGIRPMAFFRGHLKQSGDKTIIAGYFGPSAKQMGAQCFLVFLFLLLTGADIKLILTATIFLGAYFFFPIKLRPSGLAAHKRVLEFISHEFQATQV